MTSTFKNEDEIASMLPSQRMRNEGRDLPPLQSEYFDVSTFRNRNRTILRSNHRILTDEELRKGLAARLQSKHSPKWADIDDEDDEWEPLPAIITSDTDGTKATSHPALPEFDFFETQTRSTNSNERTNFGDRTYVANPSAWAPLPPLTQASYFDLLKKYAKIVDLPEAAAIPSISSSSSSAREGSGLGGDGNRHPIARPELATPIPFYTNSPQLNTFATPGTPFHHTEYRNHNDAPFFTVKQLGHGSLGIVDAVGSKSDEAAPYFARKVVRLPNIHRKRLLPLIQNEVAVMRSLSHRHIVQVMKTYETLATPRQFAILFSPVGDEDLSHFLERTEELGFPEENRSQLRKWLVCITSAVAYIHSHNIRHKDIKPSNIICKSDDVFLTDFGSAHQFSAGLTSATEGTAVGITKMYCAPEVVAFDRRGRSADVYSLGCVFAEMCTVIARRRIEDFHEFRGEPVPGEPDSTTHVYHATAHKLRDWFGTPDELSLYALIFLMTAADPTIRPSSKIVVNFLVEALSPARCRCHLLADEYEIPTQNSVQDLQASAQDHTQDHGLDISGAKFARDSELGTTRLVDGLASAVSSYHAEQPKAEPVWSPANRYDFGRWN